MDLLLVLCNRRLYIFFRHKLQIIQNNIIIFMEEIRNVIQAVAVIDIDPSFTPFFQEQQKWLTSIELATDLSREKQNAKNFLILPGVYLVLSFCEKNKEPIYQIEFNSKPGSDWNQVKMSESIQTSIGAALFYKTEPNSMSGPICDIDILKTERRSIFGQNKQIFNVPPTYKLISHQLPFGYLIYRKVKSKIEETFKAVLAEKYLSQKASRINLSQLPLFCFPEGIKIVRQIRGFLTFNFVFTLETAERIYVTSLIFKETLDEKKKEKLQVIQDGQLFYEKALCIVSNQCYTDQFGQCLQHLYRLSMSKSDIPFWRVIQTFVQQMKMPPVVDQGEVGLVYSYGGIRVNFSTNRRYPFVSQRALYSIFKFMSLQKIISVFQSLLLERKVIFVSQSKTILGYATEAFLGLLYPFRWQQVLIPILPSNLKEYLTAPVPLVAGISPSLVDSSIQSDSVLVDLDKNQILNDEDNPPLPEKLLKQLYKRLEKLQIYDPAQVTEFLQNPESTYLFKMQEVQDPQFHGHLVRDSFFEFILTLMKNYKKFMVKPKLNNKEHEQSSMIHFNEPALMTSIFKVQQFLSDLGMTKVGSFGYKFTQSSIFTSFVQRRHQKPNDPQLAFFDDCIDRKKSKKQASFITALLNKQYRQIKSPEAIVGEGGPYFYQHFPSLLQDSIMKQEIQIVVDEKQEQNKLISLIEDEYLTSNELFQQFEGEDELKKKMSRLLLNKNKLKFEKQNSDDKLLFLNSFISLYEKQVAQIQSILTEWPGIVCEEEFIPIKKYDYLLKMNKLQKEKAIIGVFQGDDYQTLIRNQTKIIFVGAGQGSIHRSSAIVIEILSHRLKSFINKILPKQAGFFIEFCLKQAAKDIRGSSLKRSSQQSWNIETLISFKNWLHYEKQYATGVTNQ